VRVRKKFLWSGFEIQTVPTLNALRTSFLS
jgi:hypothetical protein